MLDAFVSCLCFFIREGKVVVYLKSYRMEPFPGLKLCSGSRVDRAFQAVGPRRELAYQKLPKVSSWAR